tara:strand:+ start:85 stop:930 length:846 start_codon:yes stop_codon:yes gene_type:complete
MLPLLDTHQHLLYRSKANYAWTKDIPPLAEGDFTVEDYKSLTSGLGVAGSLFMEVDADNFKDETNFINSIAKNSESGIKGLIVSIRPEKNEDFESWLNESIDLGVLGYRRILHVMPDEMSQNQIFRSNLKKIGDAGKTFDLCFLQKQLPVAFELAKECENTTLILNHCGVPDIAGEGFESWSKDMRELSKLSNVFCKLSGLMAYCAPGTASLEKIEPYVDLVLNSFGPSRMVWGSDWPVVNLAKGLQEWIDVTRKILSKLSNEEATAIANGTAQNIYKVKL